ncbi:MAG: hypothetical protein AB8G15_18095 [Saprospiraceae bacterium]
MIKSIALLFSFLLSSGIPFSNDTTKSLPTADESKIQIALLLDTSNSMDGLIDQAKSQLWKMVNELATSKKNGKTPSLEIALYEYGNSGLSANQGYIRQISSLSSDLDKISEALFQLTTNGGDEYCGWGIQVATDELQWTNKADDLKIIIIAGNEPFNQGRVNYKTSCKAAIQKGIMINTIHCGDYDKGVRDFWKDGADLTDGKYLNINQDDKVVHVSTPFDDKIIKLNKDLNETYIGFGHEGKERVTMQSVQDDNAASYGAANAVTRASFKSKSSYKNTSWDLVDAVEEDEEVLTTVKEEQLPENMKTMSTKERKAYVEAQAKKRKAIQTEIQSLEKEVKAFVAKKQKENSSELTLDKVMIETIKVQANQKNFKFEE